MMVTRNSLWFIMLMLSYSVNAQNREAPSKTITSGFCKAHDLSKLLGTYEKTGFDGVFDTGYWRIQIHFESVVRDNADYTVYHVNGASRHRKVITPFSGTIKIKEVIQYDREVYWAMDTNADKSADEPLYSERKSKYTYLTADYFLSEDTNAKFSGRYTGLLTFALHETQNGTLLDNLSDYEGDGFSNFTYNGIWTSYKTRKSKLCIWGEGRLPIPDNVDVGVGEFIISERYQNNGWQRNKDFELSDDPEYWWRK